jgi:hypothetical protein
MLVAGGQVEAGYTSLSLTLEILYFDVQLAKEKMWRWRYLLVLLLLW